MYIYIHICTYIHTYIHTYINTYIYFTCISKRTPAPSSSHPHQHTSAYVSIRQHTSAYVSIRQHTSASSPTPTPPESETPKNRLT